VVSRHIDGCGWRCVLDAVGGPCGDGEEAVKLVSEVAKG
jgi:hypothetical protein